MGKALWAALAGVVAAVGSALCCAGPLVAVALGVSGAALAATFEPLRPYFVVGTIVALGSGFAYVAREEKRACAPGSRGASPVVRRRMKRILWSATGIAAVAVSFPWWSRFLSR
jgi:mercuric ion transport protein